MVISEDEQTVSASDVTDVLCCLLRLLPTVSLNTNKSKQLPHTNPSSGKRAIHNRVRFQPTSHSPRSRFYVTGEQSPDARRSHVQPTVSPHGHEQESIPLCQLSSPHIGHTFSLRPSQGTCEKNEFWQVDSNVCVAWENF